MTWEGVQPAVALTANAGVAAPEGFLQVAQPSGSGASGFAAMVEKGIGEVNQQLLTSQADLQRLAVGDVQNLHQVMIRLEESRLSFQLMLQVRSRLLEAYQDVMKMQV